MKPSNNLEMLRMVLVTVMLLMMLFIYLLHVDFLFQEIHEIFSTLQPCYQVYTKLVQCIYWIYHDRINKH